MDEIIFQILHDTHVKNRRFHKILWQSSLFRKTVTDTTTETQTHPKQTQKTHTHARTHTKARRKVSATPVSVWWALCTHNPAKCEHLTCDWPGGCADFHATPRLNLVKLGSPPAVSCEETFHCPCWRPVCHSPAARAGGAWPTPRSQQGKGAELRAQETTSHTVGPA